MRALEGTPPNAQLEAAQASCFFDSQAMTLGR